jgi:hypothetical protein
VARSQRRRPRDALRVERRCWGGRARQGVRPAGRGRRGRA